MNAHLQLAHAYGIKLALEQGGYTSVADFEKDAANFLNKENMAKVLAFLSQMHLIEPTSATLGARLIPSAAFSQPFRAPATPVLPKTAGVMDYLRGVAAKTTSLGMSVGDILGHMGQGAAHGFAPAILPI
jgi:hypothetical protein